jgi:GNAT superfamily N-acetyltransferase
LADSTTDQDGPIVLNIKQKATSPRVVELLAMAQIHRPPEERPARGLATSVDYAGSEELELWGVERDGEVVGLAGVEPRADGTLFLHDLAIWPEARGQGVGRMLVGFLRAHYGGFNLRGYTMDPATGFYRRCGFDVRPDGHMASGDVRYEFTSPAVA